MREMDVKGGRKPGRAHPHKVFTYLSEQEHGWLKAVAVKRGASDAAVLREAVRLLAREEGLS